MNGVSGATGANGHAVETASHLIENGVTAAKAVVREQPAIHDLDASKLTVTLTKSPGKVPEPNSAEIWDMRTCTDHSESLEADLIASNHLARS
jgi:branched-chain amino acid aminotransferase